MTLPYVGCQSCFCECLANCDPLAQECGEGQACIQNYNDGFMCVLDASGDASLEYQSAIAFGTMAVVCLATFFPVRGFYSLLMFYWAATLALIEWGTIALAQQLPYSKGSLRTVAGFAGWLSRLVVPEGFEDEASPP